MGRPKGSKNKTAIVSPEAATPVRIRMAAPVASSVTVMLPEDFEAGVDGGEEEQEQKQVARPAVNTDDDAPTQGQLAKAIQALADQAPVRKVPWAKFKTRSPFNPTGKKRKLVCRCYQNGFPIDIKRTSDEEISLLNKLGTTMGLGTSHRCISNMVTIVKVQNGGNVDLHIRYKNKSADDRMANKSEWRNFAELVKRCLDDIGARPQMATA